METQGEQQDFQESSTKGINMGLLGLATKNDIKKIGERIMSAISEFQTRVNAKFDALASSVDGVAADVEFLKKKIEELQNNPGPISPADQAILDELEARIGTLTTKVSDLDAQTDSAPTPTP
jgi:outer membrane murein-binding lipoprotein Lpp